jgi:hypothetical protein
MHGLFYHLPPLLYALSRHSFQMPEARLFGNLWNHLWFLISYFEQAGLSRSQSGH